MSYTTTAEMAWSPKMYKISTTRSIKTEATKQINPKLAAFVKDIAESTLSLLLALQLAITKIKLMSQHTLFVIMKTVWLIHVETMMNSGLFKAVLPS